MLITKKMLKPDTSDTADERVVEVGLPWLVRHLVDSGVHGIFVNGTMGGFYSSAVG